MGSKKLQKSLDTVKADVRGLAEAFWALRDEMMTQQAASAAEQQSTSAPVSTPLVRNDEPLDDSSGYVDSQGHFVSRGESGERRIYRWAVKGHPVTDVLGLAVDEGARLLAAIGHKQRLRIILHLLHSPATASDLVQELELGTTGAAYHHLNVLQSAGLVEQEHRGEFSVVPEQIPSLLSILTGLSGVLQVDVEIVDSPASDVNEAGASAG